MNATYPFGGDSESLFFGEHHLCTDEDSAESSKQSDNWKIMIVDDEKNVHAVIQLAFTHATIEGRGLTFLNAYSAQEARQVLAEHPDIALIVIDVVMETDSAGLDLVRHIRKRLHNQFVRIIILTGQPGSAPQQKVVSAYDINDYRNKAQMSAQNLFTMVTTGLRGYKALKSIEELTIRKQRDAWIWEQHEFFTTILEALTYPFYVINAHDYTIALANSAANFGDLSEQSTCHTLTHNSSTPCHDVEHPCPLEHVKQTKQPLTVEHIHYDADGCVRNIEIHAYPILDRAGQVVRIIEYALDITARKQAEEALRASEEYVRNIIDSSLDMIVTVDQNRRITTFNKVAQEAFGYRPEEILGKHIELLYAEQDDAATVFSTMTGHDHTVREICNRRKNGEKFLCILSASVLRDTHGERIGVVGISRDITGRRLTEEKTRQLEKAVDTMQLGVTITDTFGRIIFTNPAEAKMHGYRVEDVLGKDVGIFAPPESRKPMTLEQIEHRTGVIRESHNVRKDGSSFPVRLLSDVIIDSQGEAGAIVTLCEDITRQKLIEEGKRDVEAQLLQSQKMEAIGRLAGGIAHDFNNLLQAIIAYSEFLTLRLDEENPLRKSALEIHNISNRAASLTKQLLLFSRQQPFEPKVSDLNAIVKNIENMLRRLIGEDIELVTFLRSLKPVKVDEGQIVQVIMNLAINARDAMPDGGKLIIITETIVFDEISGNRISESRPGEFVCISVADTGAGMDETIIANIFDPFFTTKEKGKGTGLGLSTVYGIIKQHQGWINVDSDLGQGSTFKTYLPVCCKELAHADEALTSGNLMGNGERILLVEDESSLREVIGKTLREHGYIVVETGSAQEALNIFESEQRDFYLIFSDVVLPDTSGVELVEQFLAYKPELRILLSSGYADYRSQASAIREKGVRFLQKPYSLATLLQTLKAIMPKQG